MKVLKKGLAITLAAAMVLTMAPTSADAAKKPKLSKSTATLKQGDTLKLSVKYVKKSVKVKWKSSTKAVKVAKKTTKGTAVNKVTAVKKGKALVSASLKVGKKKYVLKCKVTVNAKSAAATATPTTAATAAATATVAPQATATATVVPGTPTAKPTKKPTGTPKPTPAPTPTPMPEGGKDDFASVASSSAIRLDNTTFSNVADGSLAKYDAEKDRIEINDTTANSQGAWTLPEDVVAKIALGTTVTFRVQGYYLGTEKFRFWIGTPTGGGCTPVMLGTSADEGFEIGEAGYPAGYDENGNEVTGKTGSEMGGFTVKQQIALDVDAAKNSAFDQVFTLKAGTSQDDTNATWSHLTIKGSSGEGAKINGLVIKNIYITAIDGKAPEVSAGDEGNKEEGIDDSFTKIELTADNYDKGAATNATEADGTVKFEGTFNGVFIKLPEVLKTGESIEVALEYASEGSQPRIYGVSNKVDTATTNIIPAGTGSVLKGTVTATADTDWLFLKKSAYDAPDFTSFTVKSIAIKKVAK